MNENKVKRRFGDRYEGRRIRGYNPMDRVAWYIMPRRNGATNLLAYSVAVASMEDYIRQKRAEGLDSFGITHVLLAAYVRTVSQRPALNRFLSGQKLYARNEIWVNMDVKKEMRTGSPVSAKARERTSAPPGRSVSRHRQSRLWAAARRSARARMRAVWYTRCSIPP